MLRNLSKYTIFRWACIITSWLLEISFFQAAYYPFLDIHRIWFNTGEWFTSKSIPIIETSLQSFGILPILALVMVILAFMKQSDNLINKGIAFYKRYWLNSTWLPWIGIISSTLGFSIITLLLPSIFQNFFIRLILLEGAVLICAISLKPLLPKKNWGIIFIGSVLLIATIYKIMVFIPDLSTSPFSIGWSEGSRYYYSSLFFSNRIYGQSLPLPTWHASRYMLLAIPWSIPGIPLWFHRLWQVLLWIGMTGVSSFALTKRLKIQNRVYTTLFSMWTFLFLFQGPVYYHLLICVILILWGVNHKKPVQSFLVVILASIWAGLSRVNWIPVPVFLAITLYFFEVPWEEETSFWKYAAKPIIWGTGIIAGFLSYFGYAFLSGNELSKFESSFTSDLLWYRLLPNTTYPPGIFLAITLVTIPVWVIIIIWLRNNKHTKHSFIKFLGIGLMLLVLFAGGLIVSVKIGGGSNLHNLDAYLVLLLFVVSYIFWGTTANSDYSIANNKSTLSKLITITAFIVPALVALTTGGRFSIRDKVIEANDLATLEEIVLEAASQGGEILFMSERQLQSFGIIQNIPFVPEYEKLELGEMAKAENIQYLERFQQDIKNQRFAVIIADPMSRKIKGQSSSFGEENDVWVEHVSRYILEYYYYTQLGQQSDIYIYTPIP